MSFTRKVLKMDTIPEVIRSALFPSGFIAWFNRTSAPNGWVICNGKWYSTDGLQSSDTETSTCSIKSPNLIGKYALGATSGIGDSVAAGLPAFDGTFTIGGGSHSHGARFQGWGTPDTESPRGYRGAPQTNPETLSGAHSHTVSVTYPADSIFGSSDTVTPPSVKLLPCMKL